MTWKSFHRRGEVLRAVCAAADARRDGILPTDVEGVAETFPDELALLGALQLRWFTRLAGRIEGQLADEPLDLEAAVVAAWCQTAAEMPGVRAVIDTARETPADEATARAMKVSAAKERVLLAMMAGRGSGADEAAARAGEAIEQRARAAYVPAPAPTGPARTGLVDRLKAVLAAA